MSRPPRIGLVGCGQWGQWILRDLVSLGCHCVVADLSAPGRELAMGLGAGDCVRHASELPRELDGYIVATPASTHQEVILSLLDRGRPIYVEKPLTDSAHTARSLAENAPHGLFVMEKWRYHGGVQAIADLCRSGRLGKVRAIHCRRVQSGQSQRDVNPIWTLLPHDLSIVDHILGELPTAIAADATHGPNGEALSLHAKLRAQDVEVFITISSLSAHKERSLLVSLEGGALSMVDPMADHILFKAAISPADEPAQQIPVGTEMPLLLELKAFIDHLQGGPPPMTEAARSAHSVTLIEQLLNMASSAG